MVSYRVPTLWLFSYTRPYHRIAQPVRRAWHGQQTRLLLLPTFFSFLKVQIFQNFFKNNHWRTGSRYYNTFECYLMTQNFCNFFSEGANFLVLIQLEIERKWAERQRKQEWFSFSAKGHTYTAWLCISDIFPFLGSNFDKKISYPNFILI